MSEVPSSRAPAASRTVAILRFLAESKTPLTLSQLSSGLEMLPSSCLNILRELVAGGLVERDEDTKRYALGLEVLPLAHRQLLQNRVARAAQVELDRLRVAYRCTALVTQRRQFDHTICIAVSGSAASSVAVQIGRSENAFSSAAGRMTLAFEGIAGSDLDEIYENLTWYEAPMLETWKDEIRQAKVNGFAKDQGNYRAGLTFFAAPIVSDENMLAGMLSVAMRNGDVAQLEVDALLRDLKTSSRNITSAIGGQSI